ncbi:MAG: UDP-N-acetylmuramoyl-tripeptide--D-alanyl-D-alanine ligase, partial [Myxococcota bacterium]
MNLSWSLGDLARHTDGELRDADANTPIDELVTDSRQDITPSCAFLALHGERFDGHDFAADALRQGAACVIVDQDHDLAVSSGTPRLIVEDTLDALQALARARREMFHDTVVGITGSNGKTIVKEMLASICARASTATVHRSPGSYNSQVGVAHSVLGLRDEHTLAIFEAGISRPGEMVRLRAMIQPDVGILTNIGDAHARGLPTPEITAREKLKLFDEMSGVLVFPDDVPALAHLQERAGRLPFRVRADTTTADSLTTLLGATAFDVRETPGGWTFRIVHEGTVWAPTFAVYATGSHNVANALAAAATGFELGASVEAIQEGLAAFRLKSQRLEVHTTPRGITLINDTYSSDPTSARAALVELARHSGIGRAVAIFGDMLDLGALSEQAHRELGRRVARYGPDALVGFGPRAELIGQGAIEEGLPAAHVTHVRTLDALHQWLELELRQGDTVLLKASGAMGMDQAATRLLESVGPTRLTVDLGVLRENFHALKRAMGAGVHVMPVVKSAGYGNDATRVSMTLVREGATALAVAYPDEAIPLRQAGLKLPILVTNTMAAEADKLVRYGLTGLVGAPGVARAIQREAERADTTARVHVEVDTGMHRLGVALEDLPALLDTLRGLDRLDVTGMMTHFA